jgi:hypothetical protein
MPITQIQLGSATTTLQQLQQQCDALSDLVANANVYYQNGWTINVAVGNNQLTVPIPLATQSSMVTQYDTMKANLVSLFNQLP